MNAIVENPITFLGKEVYHETLLQFCRILQDITSARDTTEMFANLDYSHSIGQTSNFMYGSGGSHLWVKQINLDGNTIDGRKLIVRF